MAEHFYRHIRDHPSVGPAAVTNSAMTPGPSISREATEEEGLPISQTAPCPSRLASSSVGCESDEEEEEEEKLTVPPPKVKQN